MQQVFFNEPFPLECDFLRDARVTVSRQIDELELVADPVKIDRLCAPWLCTCERQLLLAGEAIQQTGLPHVAPSQKRDLRESFRRKLLRPDCTDYEFGIHQVP